MNPAPTCAWVGPGDRERAAELIAAGCADTEQLGLAREIVRFERLWERMSS